MAKLQAAFYVLAIILLIIAAFPVPTRVNLARLGAAAALFAFALPAIAAI